MNIAIMLIYSPGIYAFDPNNTNISGGADRIDTYPIRISIQFLRIGTDSLSNSENLDRIGSDR